MTWGALDPIPKMARGAAIATFPVGVTESGGIVACKIPQRCLKYRKRSEGLIQAANYCEDTEYFWETIFGRRSMKERATLKPDTEAVR